MARVSGSSHATVKPPPRAEGGTVQGGTNSSSRASSGRQAVHADGYARASGPNRFSSSSHSTLQGTAGVQAGAGTGSTSATGTVPGTAAATNPAAAQFQASVSQQSTRPTVQVTAQAMTDPNSPVFKAMQAVKPPIPISNPTVGGDGIPQIKVGPVTQDQINQLRDAGFNLDTHNVLSSYKGETQNMGMRDGDTLWRVGVEPAGTNKDGQAQFTLGFYGESLPPGAPPGEGAVRLAPGVVIRAGGDTPVGEPPSTANQAFNAMFQVANTVKGWFSP